MKPDKYRNLLLNVISRIDNAVELLDGANTHRGSHLLGELRKELITAIKEEIDGE